MSTPVNTCQTQGGIQLERDSTGPPTTPAAPLSLRESVIKGDIPALPGTAHFGYATAVNGDTTLSCPSPPTFTTGDFGRPCTTATPVSADSERNISPVITCQSQDTAGSERDSMSARTPTTVVPQSSDSERNILPAITCTSQDGVELPEFEQSTVTPTHVTPLSSIFEMLTSAKTCQSEGGVALELDSKGTPTTVPPQSSDSERILLLLEILCPLLYRSVHRSKHVHHIFRRLVHVSRKVELGMSVTARPLLLLPSSPVILGDLDAAYPALQHSVSILTTQVCPSRCLLHFLLLISSRAPTFYPWRTYRNVGNPVRTDPPRGSKEHGRLRGKSQPVIFHRTDRQPQVMWRRVATVDRRSSCELVRWWFVHFFMTLGHQFHVS